MTIVLLSHIDTARRRVALDTAAVGLPLTLAVVSVGWRLLGLAGAAVAMVGGLTALGWIAWRRARTYDRAWLVAALDARVPALEDSAALLFQEPATLSGLVALQRDRLQARANQAAAVDLRPDWSKRWIIGSIAVALISILVAALWPAGDLSRQGENRRAATAPLGPPRITGARLRITPPAYTGLRPFDQTGLDARVPEGSRVTWAVSLLPRPKNAGLDFPGETHLPLQREGGRWRGERIFERSALYRVEATGLARQRLHRLEVIPDAAPVISVVAPASQLVLVTPGQARWTPVFEVRDDYGVLSSAQLRITVTKGEGENIAVTERTLPLTGQGEARRKRFSAPLDLAREGLATGGDMIVQLIAADNRAPMRQTVEGPSIILRWPAAIGLADGLDGMTRQVMPVYFRSQRQIIIDAEALIAQRARIAPDVFLKRSNDLGGDQAQLRLRYGQFMGEEAEGGGGGGLSLPTNDGLDLPTNDGPAPEPEHHDEHGPGDAHDTDQATFGDMGDVVAKFGHAHDTGDAATLFDPGTRSTLARALDAMWDSERALRQGRPKDALPFAYKALDLLKTAQQATRIFLARTPPKTQPIDFSRRLTGKREGIVSGRLPTPPVRDPVDTPAVEAWRTLGEANTQPRLDSLSRWVVANRQRLADPLALTAAIDNVRNEPDCQDCRRKLRALLWTALDRPPAGVHRRDPADARGRRYLDALR